MRRWRDAWRASGLVAGAETPTPWREDARQLALIVGAGLANILPSAWVVTGNLSEQLLWFGLRLAAIWTICTALQLVSLRWLRRARFPVLRKPLVQWTILAAGGVLLHLVLSHAVAVIGSDIGGDIGGRQPSLEEGGWWIGAVGAWSSLLAALYLVWQRVARDRAVTAAQRLQSIKRTQREARRTLVERELLAAQTQIDPDLFFDTLHRVEALYCSQPARAEALLDELIAFLRAALPHRDEPQPTLAHELELAHSFVRLHSMARGEELSLEVAVDAELTGAAVTPGLVLPLLRGTLANCRAPARLLLSARLTQPGLMDLTLASPAPTDDATFTRVSEALRRVHGAFAALTRTADGICLSLPHGAH